jgi:glucan phosphorylase
VDLQNIFILGNRTHKVAELLGYGDQPYSHYESQFELKCAIDRLSKDAFSPEEPHR